MGVLLKTEGLTKIFSAENKTEHTAVDHVSFQIADGETVGLVGESGCGKSTLAKLITRLVEPTAGTIHLNGKEITKARGKELRDAYRQVQMVFQSPAGSFDPRKTLGYGIDESMRNRGIPKAERMRRTEELLKQCGLSPEYAGRYPHEISGGQCQRAAIARALAVNPKILICDEATSALDVMAQRQILELLASLRETRGISILFICHNPAVVEAFCDRFLVMEQGRVIREETIPTAAVP